MLALLLALCLSPSCATLDPTDDALAWDAAARANTYEVSRSDETEPCMIVNGALTEIGIWATPCVAPDGDAVLTVRACNESGCGGVSGAVTFLPTMCIEGAREVPCWDGAPLRTPPR